MVVRGVTSAHISYFESQSLKIQAAAGTSEDKNSLTSFEGDEEGEQLQEFF